MCCMVVMDPVGIHRANFQMKSTWELQDPHAIRSLHFEQNVLLMAQLATACTTLQLKE